MPTYPLLLRSREATGTLLLGIALALLALVSLFAYLDEAGFRQARTQSAEIRRVLDANENLLSAIKDAETGQRGYLLTGKSRYLDPYHGSRGEVDKSLKQLLSAVRNRPYEKDRVAILVRVSEDKLEELRETIALFDRHEVAAAIALVTTNRGKQDMEVIRRLCRDIRQTETSDLNRTSSILETTAARSRFVIGFGSFSLFLLVAAAAVMIKRDIARQSQLTRDLSASQQRYQLLAEELEVRVRERTAELEAANRELETFSYSVSHDLRAPLRSIDGFSQILLEDYSDRLDEPGRDMFRRVRSATQRMGVLIDDLLKLARVGRAEFRRETVSLTDLAKAIAAELQRAQPERQTVIEVEENLVVSGDEALLRIVLENLLSNAWKFTAKVAQPRIEVGVERQEKMPVYFVRDNGAGFDMAHASRLFAPFQRLHDAREYAGTGVGLATVQRIVQKHGGRIWAHAAINRGATFYFTV